MARRWIPADQNGEGQANSADERAGDRADNSHPELGLRIGCFLFDLGHAAESKQGDRFHRQAARLGYRRV